MSLFAALATDRAFADSNDNFADAITLSGASGTVSGSNIGATGEAGEPAPTVIGDLNSVWYQWVAPASGIVTFNTCNIDTDYDSFLAAYTSFGGAYLAENDDACEGGGTPGLPYQTIISFAVSAGTTYYIQADGYLSTIGNFKMDWDLIVINRVLTVDGTGTGSGTVVGDSPSTISCASAAGADSGTCIEIVNDGTVVTLTATADSGSAFTGWTDCDSADDEVCTQTLAGGDETVEAQFEFTTHTVAVSASPPAGGSLSGGGTFAEGNSRTVVATANPGFAFVKWMEGSVQVSTDPSFTFTLLANRTLVAHFRLVDVGGDLLVDFGSRGLWQFLNNATWQKIHGSSPLVLATGDLDGDGKDEAIASFPGLGLLARYNNANPWRKLSDWMPDYIVTGDFDGNGKDDVAIDRGVSGIWVLRNNTAPWVKLHALASEGLAVGDLDGNGKDELLADFGPTGRPNTVQGLWVMYNNSGSWAKLHATSPARIATGNFDGTQRADVAADLGNQGLRTRYNNAGPFVSLALSGSQSLTSGDVDGSGKAELIADRGAAGLWLRFNNSTWSRVTLSDPVRVLAADLDKNGKAEVVVDNGATGIFARYNNAGAWVRLRAWVGQGMAAGDFD